MNKTIINVLFLSLCSINALYATPLSTAALDQKAQKSKPLTEQPNFSGTWESSNCPGDDDSFAKITIQHEGNYIEFDSSGPLPIGTMKTESNSGVKINDFSEPNASISTIEWSSNKAQLIHRGVHASKEFRQGNSNALCNAMHVVMDYNTIELNKEGQLVLKFTSTEFRDLEQVDQWSIACVFNKVSESSSTSNDKKPSKFRF